MPGISEPSPRKVTHLASAARSQSTAAENYAPNAGLSAAAAASANSTPSLKSSGPAAARSSPVPSISLVDSDSDSDVEMTSSSAAVGNNGGGGGRRGAAPPIVKRLKPSPLSDDDDEAAAAGGRAAAPAAAPRASVSSPRPCQYRRLVDRLTGSVIFDLSSSCSCPSCSSSSSPSSSTSTTASSSSSSGAGAADTASRLRSSRPLRSSPPPPPVLQVQDDDDVLLPTLPGEPDLDVVEEEVLSDERQYAQEPEPEPADAHGDVPVTLGPQQLDLVQRALKRDYDAMPEMEAPAGLICPLLPYQKQALHWMCGRESSNDLYGGSAGGILADEMGIGKTIEMLALLLARPPQASSRAASWCDSTLVVCPQSSLFQWANEIETKVAPGALAGVFTHHGATKAKTRADFRGHAVVLTTYGTLSAEHQAWEKSQQQGPLLAARWHRVVLDEAHVIKNIRSRAARAAFELVSSRRWCLTGTPIHNTLFDLYALLHFVRAPECSTPTWFRREVCAEARRSPDGSGFFALRSLLLRLLLRRTKDQQIRGRPLLTLPPCTVDTVEVRFTPDEKLLYRTIFEEAQNIFEAYRRRGDIVKNYLHIFELLLRLRQLCDHNFLVLMCLTNKREERVRGAYAKPHELRAELLAQLNGLVSASAAGDGGDGGQQPQQPQHQMATWLVAGLFGANATTCSICFEPYEQATVTPCGHTFCRPCIREWLTGGGWRAAHRSCPMCRAPCSAEQLQPQHVVVQALADARNAMKELLERVDAAAAAAAPRAADAAAAAASADDDIFRWVSPETNAPIDLRSSKLQAIMDVLTATRAADRQRKTVIFSSFTMFLDLIEQPLRAAGFLWTRLDGSMPRARRTEAITEFRTRPDITVMLISLKAGGVGLNLVEANQVILCDPWWNPQIDRQAIDRVHRLGQTQPVRVVRLITHDSIETRIMELQETKSALAAEALGEGGDGMMQRLRLTVRDLRRLFRNLEPEGAEVPRQEL